MSSYLTNAKFLELAPPLFGNVDPTTITDAITNASSFCDGYIGKRFTLPLIAPFGADLQQAIVRIVTWEMLSGNVGGFRPSSGNNEALALNYEKTLVWLREVSTGMSSPPWIDSSPDVDEEGPLSVSGQKLDFSMTTGRRCRDEDLF